MQECFTKLWVFMNAQKACQAARVAVTSAYNWDELCANPQIAEWSLWVAKRCASLEPAAMAYDEATASARETYDEAIASAWKTYDEATASAWKTYREAIASARETYDEATASAWKTYDEAIASAWKTYNETLALASKVLLSKVRAYFETVF